MKPAHRAGAALIVAMAVAFLPSCDGTYDDGPTGNAGAYTIAISPVAASVLQGGSTFITVTLSRSGGFSGAVSLTISGSPNGVSATMDPAVLSGNVVTARITLAASQAAVLGSSTVTVTATAGSQQVPATFVLTVSQAPAYTLRLQPAALTIPAGAVGTADITIDRTNFTAGITFTLENLPAAITGSFSHSPATGGVAVLSLVAAPNAGAGVHAVGIRGAAPGLADRTLVLPVTLVPASSGAAVEYLYCDASQAPDYFAYQDGAGAWQRVNPTTAGGATRFGFDLSSGRGGVLTITRSSIDAVRPAGAGARASGGAALRDRYQPGKPRMAAGISAAVDVYETSVWYATTAELAMDGRNNCAATLPVKTIRGTVAGVAAGQYGFVALGGITEIFNGGNPNNPLVFTGVKAGPADLVAIRARPGLPPDKGIILRALSIPDGGSLPSTIDFSAPGGFIPSTANATITGADGERVEAYTGLITATNDLTVWSDLSPSQTTVRPWAGVPDDLMQNGDFHSLLVFASSAANPGDFRAVLRYVGIVSNQTLTMGPVVSLPSVTSAGGGSYPRYRFQGTLPSAYQKGVGLSVFADDVGNGYTLYATGAFLSTVGSASAYDLTMPDVATLPGFPSAARLTAGDNTLMVDAFGFTGAGVLNVIPTLGSEFRASVRFLPLLVP